MILGMSAETYTLLQAPWRYWLIAACQCLGFAAAACSKGSTAN